MYALNDKHEIILATSGEVCDDIVTGSARDIRVRYYIKFKKEIDHAQQWRSAVIENGTKQPQYLGVTFHAQKQKYVSSDGKECYDPALLSSYVKLMVRRKGLLLKPHFDMGYREKFANNESLKIIHDYFSATDEEKASESKYRLLHRREIIAKNLIAERDYHYTLSRPKSAGQLSAYQYMVKTMHGGLPPLFDRQGRDYYAEIAVQSCGVEGDPRKIKLPLTGATKFYTVYFPPIAKTRHVEIIKNSLCFHAFPSSVSIEVMKKNLVTSVTDEIMWDEGAVLAQSYIRKDFEKMNLSIAAIIAMCCEIKDGKLRAYSPYAVQPTKQISWRGVRYGRIKELYYDIVVGENWKAYQDKEFVPLSAFTTKQQKKLTLSNAKLDEIPDVRSKILRVSEGRYVLSLEDGEELPLEELDLIENLPNTTIDDQKKHFIKGKQEGRLILTQVGMEYVLKKYRIPEWQM